MDSVCFRISDTYSRGSFNPIGHMSLSLMQTVGNSALIFKLEVPKKIIYCIYLAIGFCYGLVGLAVAQVLINITGALINMWATKAYRQI